MSIYIKKGVLFQIKQDLDLNIKGYKEADYLFLHQYSLATLKTSNYFYEWFEYRNEGNEMDFWLNIVFLDVFDMMQNKINFTSEDLNDINSEISERFYIAPYPHPDFKKTKKLIISSLCNIEIKPNESILSHLDKYVLNSKIIEHNPYLLPVHLQTISLNIFNKEKEIKSVFIEISDNDIYLSNKCVYERFKKHIVLSEIIPDFEKSIFNWYLFRFKSLVNKVLKIK